MSYTPCPLCGEPLIGYAGSPCTNPACGGSREDRLLVAKPLPPELQWDDPAQESPRERERRRSKRKAARGARRRNRRK